MSEMSTKGVDNEDVFMFYKEETDAEFVAVWSKIVESPELSDSCDVRLECSDGHYVHSHQSLLSISSECFREAIEFFDSIRSAVVSPNEELVIELPDSVPFEELDSILNFIYKGIVSVPVSRVIRFLETSTFLAIKGLEGIQLVFADDLDDFNQVLIMDQSVLRCKPNYVFHFKEGEESETPESSDSYSDLHLDFKELSKIEDFEDRHPPIVSKNPVFGQSLLGSPSKARKVSYQGRKPQVGSPLITEEFRDGDRYQCKVCFRNYLWKKSLVRHYKDLHPNSIELVS